jgi:hypothetical protein
MALCPFTALRAAIGLIVCFAIVNHPERILTHPA